ncbi:MAG TPA: hypothetical protein VMV89_13655 [Candidatus Paceibacterota bacterium]|nr:hypothetical protein [Candidatus Paceibacterota bacterium]
MNQNQDTPVVNRASGAALGFLLASVLFAVLVVIVKFSVTAPAIDADRDAAIAQALFQIRTNETAALDHPGWIDQSRGVVRLPIDGAMKITTHAWQNPAQARADLISRQENASKPAPVAPAKPNPFE